MIIVNIINLFKYYIELHGVKEKIKKAKLELKKSKRKDYYKILEVPKDA